MTRPSILVVEDDPAIRRGLVTALTHAGYTVRECADGQEAVEVALELDIDLVMLDVMMPKRDGFEVLETLRGAKPTLPIIMVTARGSEDDRVRGLIDGADDYVVKPFSARELLARVEAVLRRSPERPEDVSRLSLNGLAVCLERREVVLGSGERRQLSPREADILRYLAANSGRAVDRKELLHRVWGLNPRGIHTRTVDMHIARLREKLAVEESAEPFIMTVRSKGYMMAESVRIE